MAAADSQGQQRVRRPRIVDVARDAGVSKTAVSFAFNNPDRLNPETVTRIRDVADSLGYRPHPVARMLTQQRMMMLGVLTPQALAVVFRNPWFGHVSEGIAAAAERAGYGLTLVSPLHGSLLSAVGRATVDGFVAIGLSADHPEVEKVRHNGLPLVLVDSDPFPEYSSVDSDDEAGARAAAEHLLALGHRDAIVIGVEPPADGEAAGASRMSGIDARRLAGYRAAFAAAGVELANDRVLAGPATIPGGVSCLRRAWAAGLRPTAVLAMSDAMAIGAICAAREQGLDVPADISVVGFDDIDLSQHTDPPLTTVHQPIRRKGEEAVRLLISTIERRDGTSVEHERLETRLMVRGSSGPAPANNRR